MFRASDFIFTKCRNRKRKKIFDKGTKRVEKLLEVDKFLKTQMLVKAAFKVIFNKTERYLLSNQRMFVLNFTSSESSSSNEIDTERL